MLFFYLSHKLNMGITHYLLTPSVQCEFHVIFQPAWDSFWVVFIQQLDSKLNN